MPKDVSYHEAAIQYNDELAEFAGDLATKLKHAEVARWSRAVQKQHEFHADRHKKALHKLKHEEKGAVENTEDGGEDRVVDDENVPPITGVLSDPFKLKASQDTSQDAAPVANQGQEV